MIMIKSTRICRLLLTHTKFHLSNIRKLTFDVVIPQKVFPKRNVPQTLDTPDYALTGEPNQKITSVEIKTPTQIAKMRESCMFAATLLETIRQQLKAGITTEDIDLLAHEFCVKNNAYPSPLNYYGYPKSICTSVNNVACHGIPDSRPLQNGDIISVDVSTFYKGYHGDNAATFPIGDIDKPAQALLEVSKLCLHTAIASCGPGVPFNVIGETISAVAEQNGFQVIPIFCGHGIGEYFQGPPDIFHFRNEEEGCMQEGMIFTIEPVICEGQTEVQVLEDGWTAITLDNSRSAQFEHTILITDSRAEILTRTPN